MIRVVLPVHLHTLAQVEREITVEVAEPVTQARILDAVEARFPVLGGTIRDRASKRRRPLVGFCACEEDLSHEPPDAPVPEAVARGAEPFLIVGSMAGG